MFVKVCGITRPEDAEVAVEAGADAVGLIFAPSRRQVDPGEARAVVDAVGDDALVVGVFRHHLAREVLDTCASLGLRAAQLHDADVDLRRAVRAEVPVLIRATSVGDPELVAPVGDDADVVMLDAPVPGSGEAFDWTLVGDLVTRHRILLAGGLRPDTVAEAIGVVRPWGVDVASGVEADFGVKDHGAVRAFVTAAKAAGAAGSCPGHPPLPGLVDRPTPT